MTSRPLVKLLPLTFRRRYRRQWHETALSLRTIKGKCTRYLFRPRLPAGEVNLHLGCGAIQHPRFINIDGMPGGHIHFIRDIDNLSIFKTGSVDLIYASHCLEHFSHLALPAVIAEWHRVLKKGGTLRLSVPDFDLLLDIYRANGDAIESVVGILMGGQDYRYNFHMSLFNRDYLQKLLDAAGFARVEPWQPGSCELTTFDDWSNRQFLYRGCEYPVSLNLQGIK